MNVSTNPNIVTMRRPDSDVTRIYFNPAEGNPAPELYRTLADDLHTQSGGAISILLGGLSSGWIDVCRNPAVGDSEISQDEAVGAMVRRLREACTTCEDYNPDLFPVTETIG